MSYGMPSAQAKLADMKGAHKWTDFQIVRTIIYLCTLGQVGQKLEQQLLTFINGFKSHILTDSRLIFLGTHLSEDANGSDP